MNFIYFCHLHRNYHLNVGRIWWWLLTVDKSSSAHTKFDTSFAYGVSRWIQWEGRMINWWKNPDKKLAKNHNNHILFHILDRKCSFGSISIVKKYLSCKAVISSICQKKTDNLWITFLGSHVEWSESYLKITQEIKVLSNMFF